MLWNFSISPYISVKFDTNGHAVAWFSCGCPDSFVHRTVNKKQKKKLSLLTLVSQQLVSFFFSCVNGVNIKIATKINNTCILRTIAAV